MEDAAPSWANGATHVILITMNPETDDLILPATAETYPGEVVVGADLMVIGVGKEGRSLNREMTADSE